jgi:hypothetical protein
LEIRAIRQAIYHGYKLIENNPCAVFSNVHPLNRHGGQKLKKIISGMRKVLAGDPNNTVVPKRIIFLTPTNPISSLCTRNCLKGDITTAIDQASDLTNDKVFWSKL